MRSEASMSDHPYSFPIFNHVVEQAELTDRMMARTGVDPLVAIRRDGGASWLQARSRCIECAAVSSCRKWLDSEPCAPPQSAPAFCANRSFIESCQRFAENR
jgi:hypothetical protein